MEHEKETDIKNHTGRRIAFRRKELCLSQDALGKLIGLSRSSVIRYELEAVSKMSEVKLRILAKALSVSVLWLIAKDEDSSDSLIDIDYSHSQDNARETLKVLLDPSLGLISRANCLRKILDFKEAIFVVGYLMQDLYVHNSDIHIDSLMTVLKSRYAYEYKSSTNTNLLTQLMFLNLEMEKRERDPSYKINNTYFEFLERRPM